MPEQEKNTTYLDNFKLLLDALNKTTFFFTENHNALNHLPSWVWDKEKTGIDFQNNKEIVENAKRFLEEMTSSNIDIREIIRTASNPARRLMYMIRELHNLGYQKIRFYPHIGGAGYWRYIITSAPSPSMTSDVYPADTDTVWQSLGSGDQPYGWGDNMDDSISELAAKFLATYPRIAAESKGEDQQYAEWYRDMLEKTKPEGIIYFWWDGAYESTGEYIGVTNTENKKSTVSYPYDYQHVPGKNAPIWLGENRSLNRSGRFR